MDLYGADRKLSELGDGEFEDFLDHDMFTPPANDCNIEHFGLEDGMNMNQEWLENFFDDPVLNDRMMTDALQPQNVQSEHSYSLANGDGTPLNLKVEPANKDLESELLNGAVNPNMTLGRSERTSDPTIAAAAIAAGIIKQEPSSPGSSPMPPLAHCNSQPQPFNLSTPCSSNTMTAAPTAVKITRTLTHPQTILKQPTIILATQTGSSTSPTMQQASQLPSDRLVLPKVNIKVEAQDDASTSSSPEHLTMYDSIGLPPTPPSSSTSDSEGGQSPQRSAPSSPLRHGLSRQHHHMQLSPYSRNSPSPTLSQPMFTSPIPTSGVFMLTEEEKRTLIAEGYPIPAKLPLTKQEEKNLKKIRRKIKNKISAQESRRKKKEYLETLEKRVESFSQENTDLKKKKVPTATLR